MISATQRCAKRTSVRGAPTVSICCASRASRLLCKSHTCARFAGRGEGRNWSRCSASTGRQDDDDAQHPRLMRRSRIDRLEGTNINRLAGRIVSRGSA